MSDLVDELVLLLLNKTNLDFREYYGYRKLFPKVYEDFFGKTNRNRYNITSYSMLAEAKLNMRDLVGFKRKRGIEEKEVTWEIGKLANYRLFINQYQAPISYTVLEEFYEKRGIEHNPKINHEFMDFNITIDDYNETNTKNLYRRDRFSMSFDEKDDRGLIIFRHLDSSPEVIGRYLNSHCLPRSLHGLTHEEIFMFRMQYPYAWLDMDIDYDWLNESIDIMRTITVKHRIDATIDTESADLALKNKWRGSRNPLDTWEHLIYICYMEVLNNVKPIARPLVLFKIIFGSKIPDVGENIVEHGFSSKAYSSTFARKYSTNGDDSLILMINYPAGHKLAPSIKFHIFSDFISYPGEILRVDKVFKYEGINIAFCTFTGYEKHVNPLFREVIPEMKDDFTHWMSTGPDNPIDIDYFTEVIYTDSEGNKSRTSILDLLIYFYNVNGGKKGAFSPKDLNLYMNSIVDYRGEIITIKDLFLRISKIVSPYGKSELEDIKVKKSKMDPIKVTDNTLVVIGDVKMTFGNYLKRFHENLNAIPNELGTDTRLHHYDVYKDIEIDNSTMVNFQGRVLKFEQLGLWAYNKE